MGRTSDAKERLLKAAEELFYASGYHQVGVADLCKAAGVKKGSFYYFFDSKQELALTMLDSLWEKTKKDYLEPIFAPSRPPVARVKHYFAALAEWAEMDMEMPFKGCPFGNLGVELSLGDESVRLKLTQIFDEYAAYFETAMNEAVAAGEVHLADIPLVAKAMVAYAQGLMVLAKTRQDPALVRQLGGLASRLWDNPALITAATRGA